MLTGTIFDLNEGGISFAINDNHKIDITPPDNPMRWFSRDVTYVKIANGELSDGRPIKFFGCKYDGRSFSAQGYVYSKDNGEIDPLDGIKRICFTGTAIDNLTGGVCSVFDYENPNSLEGRMPEITPRPWDSITHKYESNFAGQSCEIMIDHYISYNLRWGSRQIGTCIPRLSILFSELAEISYIPDIYLAVYDFLVFLNFRRNITFDSISLYKEDSEGRFVQTADVVIPSNWDETPRKDVFRTVTLADLKDDVGKLFANIANRRAKGILDNIFVPKDESEYASVSHVTFLSCALCFEGEYDRTQPTKEETNKLFQQVKEMAKDAVITQAANAAELLLESEKQKLLDAIKNDFNVRMDGLCSENSKKKQRKIRGYADKILTELGRIDFSLEEQYNDILNKHIHIIGKYKDDLAKRMELDLSTYENLGHIFSDFRNSIGHGHPQPIERIHSYVFALGRCLTYIMILESAEIEEETITKIINKLFQ